MVSLKIDISFRISFKFPVMTAVNLYLSSPFLGLGNRRFDEKND